MSQFLKFRSIPRGATFNPDTDWVLTFKKNQNKPVKKQFLNNNRNESSKRVRGFLTNEAWATIMIITQTRAARLQSYMRSKIKLKKKIIMSTIILSCC